jgi:hypothetical protein
MLQLESYGLTTVGLVIAIVMLWTGRRRPLSRLTRISMATAVLGLMLCARFAPHAASLWDQLMLGGFALLLAGSAVEGWRGATGADSSAA